MVLYFDEEEAINELKERGYRITKEDYTSVGVVNNVKELVEFFYSRRRFYNIDRKYPQSIDYRTDTKVMSNFVRSREKLGLGRRAAVKECAVLVDALFKYEEHLHLKMPIVDIGILTNRPVVDKVCSFANGEVGEVSELDTMAFINEINEVYNKQFNEKDFQIAEQERQKILERLHDKK